MSTAIPSSLGDFEILRELGRGGMGVVYEARQVSLNRKVALKVLSGGLGLTPKAVQRFRREAEAAARLHHTNIVPVYATGDQDGTHFYAMELIEGPSLDQVLRQLRQPGQAGAAASKPGRDSAGSSQAAADSPGASLDATDPYGAAAGDSGTTSALNSSSLSSDGQYFDTVARMIADVADALDHAHKNAVIHRDIKPSNLLLSSEGRLSVNDFGLARVLEQPGMTMTGEFVGTPAYMSPEQITAGRTPLDHRTDIYSLGATLYELLTLQAPFTGQRRDQVLAQILHKEPRPPRKVNKKVPVDLETICLKALEKDPDRRYQTAGQMAEDLRRYVNRFAISARRAGPVERLRKWVRRHPGLAAGSTLALLGVLVATFFGYRLHVQEQKRRAAEQHHQQQLLEEKRQNALDKALLETLAAQFDRADLAIAEAQQLGASHGQLRMLQGQVALFRFEYDKAIRYLDVAVTLEPDSVAARALLIIAYMYDGQWDNSVRAMKDVENRPPVTAEDYLYLGRATAMLGDPDQGLKLLDEAIRRRPSALAHIHQAWVRTDWVNSRADPALAERAIEDVQFTKTLLAHNPVALDTSAYTHLAAAAAFRATNQGAKADAARAQGEKDALALAGAVDRVPEIAFNCAFYLQLLGHEEKAFEVLRSASRRCETSAIAQARACTLYRRGKYTEAVEVLERLRKGGKKDLFLDCFRAYILAELPGGREQALAVYREIAAGRPKSITAHFALTILLLLGNREEAVAGYREMVTHPGSWPASHSQREFFLRLPEYGADLIAAEKLLEVARPSRWSECTARYLIALSILSQGDREGACKHLRECLATDSFFVPELWWSRAFLDRMENDPSWPRRIQVKQ
jgi:serine/threonine protein kinase/Flp pilus assembly protein TadD